MLERRAPKDGQLPIPIYNVIRHNVPDPQKLQTLEKQHRTTDKLLSQEEQSKKDQEKAEEVAKASWNWFEMTPFEVGSEDFGAYIPTWSFGRLFRNGRSVENEVCIYHYFFSWQRML